MRNNNIPVIVRRFIYALTLVFALSMILMIGCQPKEEDKDKDNSGSDGSSGSSTSTADSSESVCKGTSNLSKIPAEYVTAMTQYTTTNTLYEVAVCTEDSDGDGSVDYMVVESTNQPEHKSVYFDESNALYEDYDYDTNIYKFAAVYSDQTPRSAGNNKIEAQTIIMRMPIAPAVASSKQETDYGTIGLALNGISFFNENAAPGDEITDELFTFDQCSGHPQDAGIYHYHVDPICLIRDLGGTVTNQSKTAGGTTYSWIEDGGTNAGLLLGFLMDGFPVYGPIGSGGEKDCNGKSVTTAVDSSNGHSHCTEEFSGFIYHYHVKVANSAANADSVFWISNQYFYGTPGSVTNPGDTGEAGAGGTAGADSDAAGDGGMPPGGGPPKK